jgi:putrescine transport system substrate-binding protein
LIELSNHYPIKRLISFAIGVVSIVVGIIVLVVPPPQRLGATGEEAFLNVYNWYSFIPASVLRQFEAETGIRVRYDFYDTNEMLEAKLLAGKSGYDVVFPSASPYVSRQIQIGAFQKLDKSLLPNLVHVDPKIQRHMRQVDPGGAYSIPYLWGTFGFAYVEEKILALMPDAPVDSYRMLFDPQVVSKFKSCHVTLLEEAIDVYPAVMAFLGVDPQSTDLEALKKTQKRLLQIRPFISRFSSQRFASELVSGETCLAQAWSGDAHLAAQAAKETGRKITIRYVVPKEGGTLWIDAMCIPKDAPHPKNAHMFVNFLLRPEISAAISNEMLLSIANKDARGLLSEDVRKDETIYPPEEVFDRLHLDTIQNAKYDQMRTRYWAIVRSGIRENTD